MAPCERPTSRTEVEIAQDIAAAGARCDIATALRGIVSARVLMGIATPREKRVADLAQFITDNNGNIRKEQLVQFLEGLDAGE